MDTGDLVDAVRAHRLVELEYRGRDGVRARIVQPHAVYRTSTGKLRMDGVQVGGHSASGALPGWRSFELMRIAGGRVLDAEFEPDPQYDRDGSKYRHGLIASA